MTQKKIIAVTGATGAQGGGLARAILEDTNSPFAVRALTRNAQSPQAQELAQLGAQVVEADIDQPESLAKALQGCYGAYFVTFFWAHFSPEKELAEAKSMAQAAKEAGLTHVIWSTLEDTRKWIPLTDNRMPTLMGNYKVPHFDAKGEANKFFTDLGVPTTFLLTSFYWDNFIYFGMGIKKAEDGTYVLTLPMGDKKLSGIAAQDIGRCAYGIFKKGEEMIGKTVGIAGEHLTGDQMATRFSKILDKEVHYNSVSPDMYRSMGFPGADDLGNMFQFYQEFEDYFTSIRKIEESKKINPSLLSFEQWLKENQSRIPLD